MNERKTTRVAKRAGLVVVFASIALAWSLAGSALSASPFQVSITSASVTGFDLLLAGTASSTAANNSGNYLEVEWGDGSSTQLPNFVTPPPWVWGPVPHTYAAEGTYTVTATYLHSNPQGNDSAKGATDTTVVTVTEPEPEPTDEPTVEPTQEPQVDPTVDPKVEPKGEVPTVKPTITRKPTRPTLAKTGAETTAAWLGVLFLAIGIVMRTVRVRPLTEVFAGQSIMAMHIASTALRMTHGLRRRMRRS